MCFPLPGRTRALAIDVAQTLNDDFFKEHDDAYKRLLYMRRRYEGTMFGIRLLSLLQGSYLLQRSKGQITYSLLAKVFSFFLIAETVNFSVYLPEASMICQVHKEMKEEAQQRELELHGHPDDIYIKK